MPTTTYAAVVATSRPYGRPGATRAAWVVVSTSDAAPTSESLILAHAMLSCWPGVVDVLSLRKV